MRRTVIGVMGPGSPLGEFVSHGEIGKGGTAPVLNNAYELGKAIAAENWVLLTGGRKTGVMDAASRGAHEAGGLVIGVLPDDHDDYMSQYVDIAIMTGMGSARNNINVISSDVVIACGLGAGTASEICLALKAGKSVVLISVTPEEFEFFANLGRDKVKLADDVDSAIEHVKAMLAERNVVV